MSDIKVGDLVMVMRAHCEQTQLYIGMVSDVREIRTVGHNLKDGCSECGTRERIGVSPTAALLGYGWWWPTDWLKRIPPLEEPEGEKRDERIEA